MAVGLELEGIPTIPVSTHVFGRLAKVTSKSFGLPTMRNCFVPQPIVGRTRSELRAYIEGIDPVNKRPFMELVLEGLTQPLDAEDLKDASYDQSTPRLLEPDTEENLRQLFLEQNWTDTLPIILPTEARVEAMLKGTSHAADEFIGYMQPTAFRETWGFDVEKVAVNAVMAGARPEYLPVILAAATTGVSARSSSTTSFATMSVVNGPIRKELGMNDGIGAMGPYNHANSTIGRAYGLLSQNLQGGSVPGDTYMGSMGNNYSYTNCVFPEAEERSPWEPYHVDKGFKPTDSVISVFFAGWYTHSGFGPRESWEEQFRRCLLGADLFMAPIFVFDPIVAKDFAAKGFTKQSLAERFSELAKIKAADFWDNQWLLTNTKPRAEMGIEPYASRLRAKPEDIISAFAPEEIQILVTGGETQGNFKMIGGRYTGKHKMLHTAERVSKYPPGLIDPWR